MHKIMLISLFSTSFDHFHFHGFLKSKRMVILKSCHNEAMHRDVNGLLRNLIAHPEPDYVSVMVYMGEVVEDQPRAEGGVR